MGFPLALPALASSLLPLLPLLVAVFLTEGGSGTTVVDFESPPVAGHRLLDPFLDPGTGVIFSAARETFPDSAVGLVWNLATSACVGPVDDDQKLGVGRLSLGDRSVGRGGAAITASFPSPLAAPVRISVEVQAPLFQVVRLRLLDATGTVVGSATRTVAYAGSPPCGGPGLPRERVTLLAESSRPVSRAVIDLVGGNVVFVADHFAIEEASPRVGAIRLTQPPDTKSRPKAFGPSRATSLGRCATPTPSSSASMTPPSTARAWLSRASRPAP